jgi:hypothetical protein
VAAVVAGLSVATHAQTTISDDDVSLAIASNGDIVDLIVNAVSGPGAGIPDAVDHLESEVIYLDGAALGSVSVVQTGTNAATITGSVGTATVTIDLLLQGGATPGDDADGHYTAKITKTISVSDTAGGNHVLMVIDDASLTRLVATGSYATGPSTENAVFSSSGGATTNNTVTQTEIGDVAGFLISQKMTQIFALEDLDRDGQVGSSDLNVLLTNFGTGVAGGPADGDIDSDGSVTSSDLNKLLTAFGTQYPDHVEAISDNSSNAQATSGSDLRDTTSTSVGGPNTGEAINTGFQIDFGLVAGETRTFIVEQMVTPEPASLALIGLGAALLAGRRSRRR